MLLVYLVLNLMMPKESVSRGIKCALGPKGRAGLFPSGRVEGSCSIHAGLKSGSLVQFSVRLDCGMLRPTL